MDQLRYANRSMQQTRLGWAGLGWPANQSLAMISPASPLLANCRRPLGLVVALSTHDHAPVCGPWLCRLFHGLPATATQLRQDRILEEALATGADPLHLAAMFGFAAETGLRYATAIAPQTHHPTTLTTPKFTPEYLQKSRTHRLSVRIDFQ
jgi:hypothetical protein